MADLLINGVDARTQGIIMGEGFIDSLLGFPTLKANIENTSRLLHGKRVVISPVRYESRELTLTFVIIGEGTTLKEKRANRRSRTEWLRSQLEIGKVTIQVPVETNDVFRLVYNGKAATHSKNPVMTVCKVSAKFEEPNPNNRGVEDDGSIVPTH